MTFDCITPFYKQNILFKHVTEERDSNYRLHGFFWWFVQVFLEYFNSKLVALHHNRWRATNFDWYRHSCPFSSEGSLTCHTYCDTGQSFFNDHLWGSVILTPVAERQAIVAVTTFLKDQGLFRPGIEHLRISRMRGERSTTKPRRRCTSVYFACYYITFVQRFTC